MREIFINFAEQIFSAPNPLSIFQEIYEYFKINNFLMGEANVLEQIWRLNNDNNLLLELGNLYYKNNNNPNTGCMFYKEYFSRQTEEHFENFLDLYNKINNIQPKDNKDNQLRKNSEMYVLYGKFTIFVVFLFFLHTKKEYQLLLEIEQYMDKIRVEIENFVTEKNSTNFPELKQMQKDTKIISSILSKTQNHNDINYLAIKLDDQNEEAYINIIDDLLTYQNYEEVLDFYNEKYVPIFNKKTTYDLPVICWELVKKYSDSCNFYKAVFYQKLALEFELGVR